VLVSESGKPIVSKPQVRPRSCSIFCCARITVNVFERAATVLRVEIANSCASDTRLTQKQRGDHHLGEREARLVSEA
jgi:hypothetical protein